MNRISLRWVGSVSAKDLGILYMIQGLLMGLIGVSFSYIIRLELSGPGDRLLTGNWSGDIYNNVITAHGIIIIFYAIMPILIGGFGNYFMPLQIGAPEISFPRINGFSLWLLIPSAIMFMYSTVINRGIGQGWTMYYPLTSNWASSGINIDATIFSFHLAGISSLLGAINMITTIYNMRCNGLYWSLIPLYTWAILITAVLLLLSLPVFTVAVTLMLLDRNINSSFYEASSGGDSLLYVTLFWLFGKKN